MLTTMDIQKIRKDFPILRIEVHGHPLVYFDNAATTHKPIQVIDSIQSFYLNSNSNIHRGVHYLSQQATDLYENAREKVRSFINAQDAREIVFVRGATEAINLVVQSYGRSNIKEGDEIIISEMEHHSNIVPWQLLADEVGAKLLIIPMNDSGNLDLGTYQSLISPRTKIVAVTHMSNSLGTINQVDRITEIAHSMNIPILIDGAQSIAHQSIDVTQMDCDFFVFSGHKVFGPTGIGVLYAKKHILEKMPPYQGGGDMILEVSFTKTEYNEIPYKFEAGTPDIAGAIGLGVALDYLTDIGLTDIAAYEHSLLSYASRELSQIDGLTILGNSSGKGSIISFTLDSIHPHDVGTILDSSGIAVRTGHHCTQPVMDHYGVPATTRVSMAFYNTTDEIDKLIHALRAVKEMLS